jgi:hypothetical protein
MMIVMFSAPLFFLCSYLAFACFRKARYQHSIVLALVASFMLALTLGVLCVVYLLGVQISLETSVT